MIPNQSSKQVTKRTDFIEEKKHKHEVGSRK